MKDYIHPEHVPSIVRNIVNSEPHRFHDMSELPKEIQRRVITAMRLKGYVASKHPEGHRFTKAS